MDGITYIDPKGDSRHLITNSKDQSIKLWDIRQFSPATGQANTRQAVLDQNWDYRWQRVPKKCMFYRTLTKHMILIVDLNYSGKS